MKDLKWTKIGIHEVVLEWLRGERDTKFNFYPPWLPVIDSPNLRDPVENHKRLRLLYIKRGPFIVEIPPDTEWWEIHGFTENELDELYLSARYHPSPWNDAGVNKLDKAAAIIPQDPIPMPWSGRIILWGHDKAGPFTIMEGNHRLLGYARDKTRSPLNIDVYVGISPSYCYWHALDPAIWFGRDLYKSNPRLVVLTDWLGCV
jgi:hypothetical protein